MIQRSFRGTIQVYIFQLNFKINRVLLRYSLFQNATIAKHLSKLEFQLPKPSKLFHLSGFPKSASWSPRMHRSTTSLSICSKRKWLRDGSCKRLLEMVIWEYPTAAKTLTTSGANGVVLLVNHKQNKTKAVLKIAISGAASGSLFWECNIMNKLIDVSCGLWCLHDRWSQILEAFLGSTSLNLVWRMHWSLAVLVPATIARFSNWLFADARTKLKTE